MSSSAPDRKAPPPRTGAPKTTARPALREQQRAETRRRILEAARSVFERRGFAACTVDDIVAEAESSRATFYLYFASKADVLKELRSEHQHWSTQAIHMLDSEGPLPREDVRRWVERATAYWDEHAGWLSMNAQMSALEPDSRSAIVHGIEAAVEEALPHYLGRRRAQEREVARVRVVLLLLMIERAYYHWLAVGHPFEREATIDALTDIWWTGLNADEPQAAGSPGGS